ncbi:hypothetical protein EVAR_101978_1 [Eumeta japonica]|uniref:Uncharacterized protein n=1 Tax=Eumeta variegata TaxID=151549 RepID=A0A4C1TSH4_EUMVA|nr:hypothetical protein EVAR_101978_1 [Eumeta japonica]
MPCGCNPMKTKICKICNKKVSKKKGIKCEGACQRWIHYKCLKGCCCVEDDIKKGLIKIRCPCPECEDNASTERAEIPPAAPCFSAPALSKFRSGSPSTASQSNTSSRNVSDFDECTNNCLGAPIDFKRCLACSPRKPKAAASPSTCSRSSSKSIGLQTRRPCPTPIDCEVEQVCRTVSEIANEIDTLMKRLKTVLEQQESCPSQKCHRKCK